MDIAIVGRTEIMMSEINKMPLQEQPMQIKINKMNSGSQGELDSGVPSSKSSDKSNNIPGAMLSKLPHKEPVHMSFEEIAYTVDCGFRQGTKKILHEVYGRFAPGQMVAIMGPSGAGKSTLLDCLSGYRISGVSGTVYVNGRGRDLNTFKKMSCYIMQEDRLQPLLTVWESMRVAANLKLDVSIDQDEKDETIEDILSMLKLYDHRNTKTSRLSGGQKKRLSIALELINNPLIMFLDEPTTGLDSSSCTQVIKLLKKLAAQGRTIICTVHQPSATLFQMFDQVYVVAGGRCMYQGTTSNLIPFLSSINMPCKQYHNPADFIIEIASEEYGEDKIDTCVKSMENGRCLSWFEEGLEFPTKEELRTMHPLGKIKKYNKSKHLEETSDLNQMKVLIKRGFLMAKRDITLTYLRIAVNLLTGIMLGVLYIGAGNDGSKVFDNYKLLFAILMHHMMSTMMLTILTFPTEMAILQKEHFNRWYSLRSYYVAVTIVDIPITVICCLIFSVIIYIMSSQPLVLFRFGMFFSISLLVVFVAQSFGLMIGALFNVVNGTFLGPTLSVPMMMFAGFGVTLTDLPNYLYWGSYISYLRYGLEGFVGAIYGEGRPTLDCNQGYCHYRYIQKFLSEIAMRGDQFWYDIMCLLITLFIMRFVAYFLLKWKLKAVR